jgi:predicted nucleotidyltransferase
VASEDEFERLVASARKVSAILRDAGIPHALAGGLAAWARGGPKTEHDVDFMVEPDDADAALEALARAGLRTERPPEGWLYKAYDGDLLVDLIFNPSSGPVTDELLERAEVLEVQAMPMRVARLEDVMVTKLMALTEQEPDFGGVLEIARSLREQIDWNEVRARTADSPFAAAFFTLLVELQIVTTAS